MSVPSSCTIEKADFRGWPAVYLRNGITTAVAVPDIGGRLMAYNLGPYEFLFMDRDLAGKLFTPQENAGDGSLAAWKNYGGDKTWPSPQGWETDAEWHGPPDPVLDSGRYRVSAAATGADAAWVEMVSPPDPRTGLQITRKASLHAGGARLSLDLTFTNISRRPVRWSIWDIVQLRAERRTPGGDLAPEPACVVTVPLNPNSRFEKGFNVMFGQADNPQWGTDPQRGLFVGRYQWEIGKVGIDSQAGWVAFSNAAAGYAFAERFDVTPGAQYPDGGATVECWTVGRGRVANLDYEKSQIYLMETEVLSPLYDFEPGQSRSFRVLWGACRCPAPVTAVTEAGCMAEPLSVEVQDGWAHLRAAGGAFETGELKLAWLDGNGRELTSLPLGPVGPRRMLLLDEVSPCPPEAAGAALQTSSGRGAWRSLSSTLVAGAR